MCVCAVRCRICFQACLSSPAAARPLLMVAIIAVAWRVCGGILAVVVVVVVSEATRILFASTMGTHHLFSLVVVVVVVMVMVVVVVVVTVLVGVWLTAHDESIMTRCAVLAVHSRGLPQSSSSRP